MFIECDVDYILDRTFAHLDERVDCLSRLPVITIPFMSADGFPLLGVARHTPPEPFLTAGSASSEDPRPSIHIVVLDTQHGIVIRLILQWGGLPETQPAERLFAVIFAHTNGI
jgi:hypothetical protein